MSTMKPLDGNLFLKVNAYSDTSRSKSTFENYSEASRPWLSPELRAKDTWGLGVSIVGWARKGEGVQAAEGKPMFILITILAQRTTVSLVLEDCRRRVF